MNILKINLANIDIDDLETKLINNYTLIQMKKINYYFLENWQDLDMQTLSMYMSRLKYILGGYDENELKKKKYLVIKDTNNLKYLDSLCQNYNYDLLYDGSFELDSYEIKELFKHHCTCLIENSSKSSNIREVLANEFFVHSPFWVKTISYIPENNNYYQQDNFLNKYDFQDSEIVYYNEDVQELSRIKCKDFNSKLNKINYANEDKTTQLWFLYKTKSYTCKLKNEKSTKLTINLRLNEKDKSNFKELYNLVKELKRIQEFTGEFEKNKNY